MTEIIRAATRADSKAMNDLYNPLIIDSHVSFCVEPWTTELREKWWDERLAELPTLVAEVDGKVVGLTYGSRYRPRPAYESSVETTIVLDPSAHGRGLGTRLLGRILEILEEGDFHRAIAIIALPNEASVGLHHKLGFRMVGILTENGFKLGRYWDIALMERDL